VLLALTTGHKIGLLVFAGIFVAFALLSAMVFPRFRTSFPGRGLPLFLLATVALFASMLTAVLVFGRESEEAGAHGEKTTETSTETTSKSAQKVTVQESEFKIVIPSGASLKAGTYEFEAENDGKVDHDLAIAGPGVDKKTPVFGAGKTESLEVTLEAGTYDFYCSVPGHKQAGMDLKVTVS
jgi:plastocyanin